jgi:hypothetical protein
VILFLFFNVWSKNNHSNFLEILVNVRYIQTFTDPLTVIYKCMWSVWFGTNPCMFYCSFFPSLATGYHGMNGKWTGSQIAGLNTSVFPRTRISIPFCHNNCFIYFSAWWFIVWHQYGVDLMMLL